MDPSLPALLAVLGTLYAAVSFPNILRLVTLLLSLPFSGTALSKGMLDYYKVMEFTGYTTVREGGLSGLGGLGTPRCVRGGGGALGFRGAW